MAPTLDDKVVIVTGGGRGLGRAMAGALAAAGARVGLLALEKPEVETVAHEIAATGGTALPVALDLCDPDACAAAVERMRGHFGAPHGLVNNAGIDARFNDPKQYFLRPPFYEVSVESWRAVIDVNLNAPYYMARAAAPHLVAQGWGRIVNVTTSYGTMQRKGYSPYGMTKAGLETGTMIWARDLDGTGVIVNVLVPGGAADTAIIPEPAGFGRRAPDFPFLDPSVMRAPILWLMSAASDGVTMRRFLGRDWDPSLPPADAAAKAGHPAGWAVPPGQEGRGHKPRT
ncbi:MAG: SDR family NAD(P)-dependent oxidoreductase [Alphaproteobacteria bacterium]|nr:SDR family NAD(P)-dependent oxidoreductase [Alphaproteobacteria bacterium]